MAASCTNLARSALLKGVRLLPGGRPRGVVPAVGLQAAQGRTLHLSLSSSTQTPGRPQTNPTPNPNPNPQRREDEETHDGPEYIPRRKAKNPIMKVGYAWMIGLPTGILAFILAKREVDKNRLKQLKIRQRMMRSNEGDYEGSRYRNRNRGDEGLEVDR